MLCRYGSPCQESIVQVNLAMKKEAAEPELLDIAAASQAFGIGRSRLYQLAISGQVPARQLNGKGKLWFKRSDIEALMRPAAKVSR